MTSSAATRTAIIVAWDGSRASSESFATASALALQLGAEVEILHVLAEGADQDDVAKAVREVGLDGLSESRLRIETGRPAETILSAATDQDVGFVVMTTHGDSTSIRRRLGSVAQAVIADSEKPVILVRPGTSHPGRQLRRLLLPLDGTPKTAVALQPATELASRLGASIDLLYVAGAGRSGPIERGSIGAPRYVDQKQHEWPDWAGEVKGRLAHACAQCPPEVPLQMYLAQGDIATEIARFSVEHACDAIVLVRRSRLQAGRALILRAALERAPCPILILGGPDT